VAVDSLQNFLDLAAVAPPERDARYFRAWQRVSVQVQRAVREFAAKSFFAEEWRVALNQDRAFTLVVYSSCHPCYGRRPMDFTYDIGDLVTLSSVLRLIGRGMQTRLAEVSAGIEFDPRLKRRFLPVWHMDILKAVKTKPRLLIETLAREGEMINTLIELGTTNTVRNQRRFLKCTVSMARLLEVDSSVLQELVLRTGAENLIAGRVFEDGHLGSPGSPDTGIGGNENRDDGSAHRGGQVADAGVVPDIQACS
jgi:hypothetical protein